MKVSKAAASSAVVALWAFVLCGSAPAQASNGVHGGTHVSAAARTRAPGTTAQNTAPSKGGGGQAFVSCSTPGSGNFLADCKTTGRPVNEPSIATNRSVIVVGANDYNSYNGQSQDGFYWSSDGVTWNDGGPLDVYPHDPDNSAADPTVAVDSSGVAYYSTAFHNFFDCTVGGVELLRGTQTRSGWSWSRTEIEANSSSLFHDKPTMAVAGGKVFVSWTAFDSCFGGGLSPIKVAILPAGSKPAPPTSILSVPGSTYSQGSTIAPDGNGGFWIAWEEFPSGSATVGSIKVAHYTSSGWDASTVQVISPAGFTDLPSPLPGFQFRTDSFPAIAMLNGSPRVVWTSADAGTGRVSMWSPASGTTALVPSGGDQFFPAIAPDGRGGTYVSFGQTNQANASYDEYVWHNGSVAKVSTAPSFPNNDPFFRGGFIGDYNSMTVLKASALMAWADVRRPDPNPAYSGYATDVMTAMQQ